VKRRVFLRLAVLFLVLIASSTLVLDLVLERQWRASLQQQSEADLRRMTSIFAARIAGSSLSDPFLQESLLSMAQAAGARALVIDSQGRVLADSARMSQGSAHAAPQLLEMPEFRDALNGRAGSDLRKSAEGVEYVYVAQPVPGGAVRLAHPLAPVRPPRRQIWWALSMSAAVSCLFALVLAALAAKSISSRLERILAFAGRLAEGDFSARLEDDQQDEISQVAHVLNATARRLQSSFRQLEHSRSELEALLNSMQEPVISISRDGRALWANQPMEVLAPTGIRLGQPVVQTVRDPNFLAIVQEAAQHGRLATARVMNVVPGRVFAATVAPMPSGDVVAVFHDLTESESIERTRRDFIANVSHELRTPLTSIQGYAETLLEGSGSRESLRDFLEIIRKNAQRMARLTEDLLILARVESGDKKLQLRPLPAADLLRDASDYFYDHCADPAMTLEVSNEALKMVSADRDVIFQVFSNLIDNACKYASQGGRIEIGARDVDGFVQFYVRDFGPGIPSEHLPRLFERFYRVDKARSRESGGTGLGLAIAKHIMLAHGGTITAESELNHGSVFVFNLPEARAATA